MIISNIELKKGKCFYACNGATKLELRIKNELGRDIPAGIYFDGSLDWITVRNTFFLRISQVEESNPNKILLLTNKEYGNTVYNIKGETISPFAEEHSYGGPKNSQSSIKLFEVKETLVIEEHSYDFRRESDWFICDEDGYRQVDLIDLPMDFLIAINK